jgi:superfamily II DNA or RNA helicase
LTSKHLTEHSSQIKEIKFSEKNKPRNQLQDKFNKMSDINKTTQQASSRKTEDHKPAGTNTNQGYSRNMTRRRRPAKCYKRTSKKTSQEPIPKKNSPPKALMHHLTLDPDSKLLHFFRVLEMLKQLMTRKISKVVVMTKSHLTAHYLSFRLNIEGITAAAVHDHRSQTTNDKTIESFNQGHINIIITTFDIKLTANSVENIINYDMFVPNIWYVNEYQLYGDTFPDVFHNQFPLKLKT